MLLTGVSGTWRQRGARRAPARAAIGIGGCPHWRLSALAAAAPEKEKRP
jgi:hypothetical protein